MEHSFHDDGVDMGVFCTYKYLNGGPGSSGGLYVHSRHLGAFPGLPSWFSSDKAKQFDMRTELEPATTAGAYQIGTPNLLSMAPLLGALRLVHDAGLARIRKRSLALTSFMMERIDSELSEFGFALATPRDPARRGAHVALRHAEAPRICKALKAQGVIPDFRPPNIVRLAPSPYYTSFAETAQTVAILKDIARRRVYLDYENVRDIVA
jgi:kynureninase